MDLRQLRYFVTVAEELHFGRAAQRLTMTQPPLSQQIQALEEEIGVQLFARTRRSVALTPAGQQWLPEVRRVLADAAALPGLAQRLARGEAGTLSLAFVSTADYGILPDLLGAGSGSQSFGGRLRGGRAGRPRARVGTSGECLRGRGAVDSPASAQTSPRRAPRPGRG